jgi:hypothetical protein
MAFHEAGHAVAAVAQRIGLESVSILPDKTRGTFEYYSGGRINVKPGEFDVGDRGVILLLSGIASQKKHAPTSVRRFSGLTDYEKAKQLVFGRTDPQRSDDPLMVLLKNRWEWLVEETRQLIEANWLVVGVVADRLLETGELSGKEVETIFRRHRGIRRDCERHYYLNGGA